MCIGESLLPKLRSEDAFSQLPQKRQLRVIADGPDRYCGRSPGPVFINRNSFRLSRPTTRPCCRARVRPFDVIEPLAARATLNLLRRERSSLSRFASARRLRSGLRFRLGLLFSPRNRRGIGEARGLARAPRTGAAAEALWHSACRPNPPRNWKMALEQSCSKHYLITRQRQPVLASGKASGRSSAQRMRGGGSWFRDHIGD